MTNHYFYLTVDETKSISNNLNLDLHLTTHERSQAIKKFILSIENKTILSTKEKLELENLKIKQAVANRINEKESLKLRKLEAETELVERQLVYSNTFGNSPPTPQGQKAMKNGVNNEFFPNNEYQNISKFIILRKDTQNSNLWNAKCDICKEGENYETHKEAIDDMIRHVTSEHAKKVRYVR